MLTEQTLTFTVADAKRHAEDFCRRNPAWKPICELTDEADYSPLRWKFLSAEVKRWWRRRYGRSARDAWAEFGTNKPMPYRTGCVSGAGVFYADICDVPLFHNSMMVVEVGGVGGCVRPAMVKGADQLGRRDISDEAIGVKIFPDSLISCIDTI